MNNLTRKWLLLLDLDGTVWDHKDISMLNPPFRRVDDTHIIDSTGIKVKLNVEVLYLLNWARKNNAVISTLSWNDPDKAMAALKAFDIADTFDYFAIEDTYRKDIMILKLLDKIKSDLGITFEQCEIVYIDDNDIHIHDIYKNVGKIHFLHYGVDFVSFIDVIETIKYLLDECWDDLIIH
jgi:magnesium-dependent phosphatase-1